WGRMWRDNLGRRPELANPWMRGLACFADGAVVDLEIGPGVVRARIAGAKPYRVKIRIARLDDERWRSIARACWGRVGSLVELARGRLSPEALSAIAEH